MWASLSLLLVILTLALSLRFYWSHCWPHSVPSGTVSQDDWQGPRLDSTSWNRVNTNTPPVLPSSEHDSNLPRITQIT